MPSMNDEDEDAWNYSFPPSTESLPLKEKADQVPIRRKVAVNENFLETGPTDDDSVSISSSNNGVHKEKLAPVFTSLSHISRTSSHSSSLQSPFIKSALAANPHTTKQDATSSFDDSFHNASANRNNLRNTIKVFTAEDQERAATSPVSPKIIAYRKSKRSASEGVELLPTTPPSKPSYDTALYIDEKFKDTQYRYAIMKRNTDFHQLFRSVDLTDRLLDDFSCALSREILLQGRIYISENYICFNSSLLGWVTNLIIEMSDIIGFEKKFTAGLFPNGIQIETKDNKYTFASLISRDSTFDFMEKVWGRKSDHEDLLGLPMPYHGGTPNDSPKNYPKETDTPRIQNYLMSLDGDDDKEDKDDDDNDNDYDDEEVIKSKVIKFKKDTYQNHGPDSHTPTEINLKKDPNEIELCDETLDAPVGMIYEILFSSSNTSFHKRFITSQNGSEISEYEEFHPTEDDPTSFERKISYRRALGYSIGPKSTKCDLVEVIDHVNFTHYILVITTTTTPDVPLGNVFSVKTKYLFTWAEDNKTRLVISYYIEWTGRSWIKAIIEKQSYSGQKQATEDLIKLLKEELADTTYYEDGPLMVAEEKVVEKIVPKVQTQEQAKEELVVEKSSTNEFMRHNIVTVCYLILSFLVLLLILQLRIFKLIKETKEMIRLLQMQLVLSAQQVEVLLSKLAD